MYISFCLVYRFLGKKKEMYMYMPRHIHSYIKASMLCTILYLVGFLLKYTLLFISPHSTPLYGYVDGHLGCFESLPFTNSTARNSLIILGKIPVELLHQRVNKYNFATSSNTSIGILPFFYSC